MPFTPAHAVVAIPLLRTPLVPAAVAIGSMTPDIPLFIPVGPDYWFTHSWLGALLADLPISGLLLVLWWTLLRGVVPQLTPTWLAQRWPRDWSTGWHPVPRIAGILVVIVSLAAGIATHILWDDFTHPGRWWSVLFPQLDVQLGPLIFWTWAHYVSSVLGLLAIGIWGSRWLLRQRPTVVEQILPRALASTAWVAVPICLLIGCALVAVLAGIPRDAADAVIFAERAGRAGAALILALFLAAALVTAVLGRARHARDWA